MWSLLCLEQPSTVNCVGSSTAVRTWPKQHTAEAPFTIGISRSVQLYFEYVHSPVAYKGLVIYNIVLLNADDLLSIFIFIEDICMPD